MSATLLEQARSAHEDVERLERLVVKELQKDAKTHKERLGQDHKVKAMVDFMVASTAKLVDIYEDEDGARNEEIAALGGQTATGQNNVFSAFYDRLKEIREYHRRHPNAQILDAGDDLEEMLKEEPYVEFSGEEAHGRYLDMHELYHRFINSKFGSRIEYSAYLEEFSRPHKLDKKYKFTKAYNEYLEELLAYLVSFFERTKPLQDVEKVFAKVTADFEERWLAGTVERWEDEGPKHEMSSGPVIDLDQYHSVDELVELGGDKLKEALASLGLKIGGTLQQRAERLWLAKLYPLKDLDSKHFAKGKQPAARKKNDDPMQIDNGGIDNGASSPAKEIALTECKIRRLCDLLSEAVDETKGHVEKKQALTYEEMEAEREEEEVEEAESESEEEEQPIYNPLKLPLGWDGKPIPYWLYKLHGLGQEFKCEICGNDSYWGRRAFERHFKEWKHQHGMRCLGIPNTKNFHEITFIKDAKLLWERIQERSGVNRWRPDEEEEYEDRDGNVYNKKTYTDLQRQGLI